MFLHKFFVIRLGLLAVIVVESGAKIFPWWLQVSSRSIRGISAMDQIRYKEPTRPLFVPRARYTHPPSGFVDSGWDRRSERFSVGEDVERTPAGSRLHHPNSYEPWIQFQRSAGESECNGAYRLFTSFLVSGGGPPLDWLVGSSVLLSRLQCPTVSQSTHHEEQWTHCASVIPSKLAMQVQYRFDSPMDEG